MSGRFRAFPDGQHTDRHSFVPRLNTSVIHLRRPFELRNGP